MTKEDRPVLANPLSREERETHIRRSAANDNWCVYSERKRRARCGHEPATIQ